MRKILPILLLFAYTGLKSQNVGIGTNKPLSKLHVAGDLRVDSLSNKDSGVVIHNRSGVLTSVKFTGKKSDLLRGDGTFQSLDAVAATSPYWLTTGNAGVDTAINFIGTTDKQPLRFRVNNTPAGALDPVLKNISFGIRSLGSVKTGHNNVVIGNGALQKNTNPAYYIAIGDSALFNREQSLYGGPPNIAVGARTLFLNKSGLNNIAVGHEALYANSGSDNVAIGAGAMRGDWDIIDLSKEHYGGLNVAIGNHAMISNTTGEANVSIGHAALAANTSGNGNTVTGSFALSSNTTGRYNTANGIQALVANTYGNENTAIGAYAMIYNIGGGYNTAVGSNSLNLNGWGGFNTTVGTNSLYSNYTGNHNTANGYNALFGNTTGNDNVGIGSEAVYKNDKGQYNTAVGRKAMYNTKTNGNTAVGYKTLFSNLNGTYNTALGFGADVSVSYLTNATAIGYNAKVNASNKVRIGNAAVTKIEGQVPFSTPSDGRYKFNVKDDVKGLDFIMKLRPVTYQFDVSRYDTENESNNIIEASYSKAQSIRRTGFIAQEVETAAKEIGYNFSGINKPESDEDHYSLSYEAFVVPLVKGMQDQQVIIERQQVTINNMQKELAAQKAINTRLLNAINTLQNEINGVKSHQK